jgi:hypothetical protein
MAQDRTFVTRVQTTDGVFRCDDQVIILDHASRWRGRTGIITRLHGPGDPDEGTAMVEFRSGDEIRIRLDQLEGTGR